MKKHPTCLIVLCDTHAFGRTVTATQIGSELVRRGGRVVLIHDVYDSRAVRKSRLSHQAIPQVAGSLLLSFFEDIISRAQPDVILLCDGQSVARRLVESRLTSEVFTSTGIPVYGVDTWAHAESGSAVDLFGTRHHKLADWPEGVTPLTPAPISRLDGPGNVVCGLADVQAQSGLGGAQRLGRSRHPIVLMTTAPWQHGSLPPIASLARSVVPAWIAHQLAAIPRLRVVHVGPQKLPMRQSLGDRYQWRHPATPSAFEKILERADMLISFSPVATTMARAISRYVPVVWIRNSSQSLRVHNLALPRHRVVDDRPIYPFAIWPLGYHYFLSPVLERNPLIEGIRVVELGGDTEFMRAVTELLCSSSERSNALDRQHGYKMAVSQRPSSAEVLFFAGTRRGSRQLRISRGGLERRASKQVI